MRFRKLGRTGYDVSVIGFGASTLGNVFGDITSRSADAAVSAAINNGINLFDVSPYYGSGLAEERLGSALNGKRNSVYLATKFGRYGVNDFDFSKQRVTDSLEDSLRRLRTDYIDLYQAHDIEFGDIDQITNETLPALERLRAQGKVRRIGITGYWPGFLARVLKHSNIDTVLNYCHANLFVDDIQTDLIPVALEVGVGIINASPLHMGLLGPRELPSWHPAPEKVIRTAIRVQEICKAFGQNPIVVALRSALDFAHVDTTLIGISSPAEVAAACEALDYEAPAEMAVQIQETISSVVNTTWPQGKPENEDRATQLPDGKHPAN